MEGYPRINLKDILKSSDEVTVKKWLEKFYCPYNSDVEDFIKNKSITFALQGLAGIWLVFASFKGNYVPVGYFAIANKYFHIDLDCLSKTLRKKIQKFATLDKELGKYVVVAPLIGQLGKNYANDYDKLITGDELLQMACDTVKDAQRIIGGKTVYLECEDTPKLINFYERNGFFKFNQRSLDKEEKETLRGEYLIQFLKYLKD